jgi:hypothetical protein
MLDFPVLPIQVSKTQIIHCEIITLPDVRFIDKYYDDYPNLSNTWSNDLFEINEVLGVQSPVNDGSYCVLYCKDNNNWLVVFKKPAYPSFFSNTVQLCE